MSPADLIPILLTLAWLAPLAGCVATWVTGWIVVDRQSRLPAWIAIGGMAVSLNLALVAAGVWWQALSGTVVSNSGVLGRIVSPAPLSGTYYSLAEFGSLHLTLDYYIDSLTLLLFGVVTLIATGVHIYALSYMTDGHPDDAVEDHPPVTKAEVNPDAAIHDAQPTAFCPQLPRFYAQLQFFVFAMLGLILAGNLLQVFAFWELVGATSYFLIGFHFERPHAAWAATKAFVFNRVGDAGFVIGMVILWTAFGLLRFDDRWEREFIGSTWGQVLHHGLLGIGNETQKELISC